MVPWIFIIVLLIFSIALSSSRSVLFLIGRRRIRIETIIGFVLFAVFFVFRAFRKDSVGGDLFEYKTLFNYISTWSWQKTISMNTGYELGWVIFNKFLSLFASDFRIVIVVVAAITTIAVFWFTFRYSPDPCLAIFIYVAMGFWGSSFNNERQALAIALLLLSLYFVEKRRLIPFLLMIVLASFIHLTSIVFVITYFIYGRRFKKEYFWFVGIVGIACFFLAEPILNFVVQLLPTYRNKYSGGEWGSGGGYGYLLMLILLCAAIAILLPKKADKRQALFVFMVTIAALLQVFSTRMGFFQRLVKIFSVAMVVLVPYLLKNIHSNASRTLAKCVIVVGLSAFFLYGLFNDTIALVPYESIF